LNKKYLIDSVILIDHLNHIKKATTWLKKLKNGEGCISAITRAEVLSRVKSSEENLTVTWLLDQFACQSIDPPIADKAAQLRREFRWKLPDAFQVAIAETWKISLVTRNTKDFSSKKFPFVIIPYTLKTS